jgi:hypothetical protein
MLHVHNEIVLIQIWDQLRWSPKNAMGLNYGSYVPNDSIDHCLNQLFKLSQNEVGQSFKQTSCSLHGGQHILHNNIWVH